MPPTPEELAAAQAVIDAAANPQVKITFDENQQKKVVELILAAKSEAAKDLRKERDDLKTQNDAAQTELAEAKAALAAAKTPGAKKEAKGDLEAALATIDEVKAAAARNAEETAQAKKFASQKDLEMKALREEMNTRERNRELLSIASKYGFFRPELVVNDAAGSLRFDEVTQKFRVVGKDGADRFNDAIDPMSADEFFAEYAKKEPWMVRSDVKPGSGSGPNPRAHSGVAGNVEDFFGPKSNPLKTAELKRAEPARYKALRAQAVQAGILQS